MNTVVFSSGIVPDGMDPEQINDPNLFGIWDRTFKMDGSPAHFFWEVYSNEPRDLLRPPVTNDPLDPRVDHSTTKTYQFLGNPLQIVRIETRVLMRALPYEVIDLLIQSNDLDPAVRAALPTIELAGTKRVWRRANMNPATGCCNRFDKCFP
jgi:hypothetical protein